MNKKQNKRTTMGVAQAVGSVKREGPCPGRMKGGGDERSGSIE